MINAIPGQNLPVLNFPYNLPKPWTADWARLVWYKTTCMCVGEFPLRCTREHCKLKRVLVMHINMCYWPSGGQDVWILAKAHFCKTQERIDEANIQPSWLDKLGHKALIIWPKRELFLAGPTREVPSGQDGLILPARVVNQKAGIASSCLLANSLIQQK